MKPATPSKNLGPCENCHSEALLANCACGGRFCINCSPWGNHTHNFTAILSAPQSKLVDEIKTYHAGVKKSFEHQVQYAFMSGLKLLALKDTCDHGNKTGALGFMAIREQFLPDVSRSAATRYMEFFQLCEGKLPTVGNIRYSNLLLENGELPQKEKEKVLAAVYEAADGKSWTAFYRDLGMVREKKPAAHHPAKPLSPDEQLAERKQSAVDAMNRLLGDLALMRLEHWADLSKADQQHVLDELIDFGRFTKQPSPEAAISRRWEAAKAKAQK